MEAIAADEMVIEYVGQNIRQVGSGSAVGRGGHLLNHLLPTITRTLLKKNKKKNSPECSCWQRNNGLITPFTTPLKHPLNTPVPWHYMKG